METIIDIIDTSNPLPHRIAIKSENSHLYRIGFSHIRYGLSSRKWIYNPFLIFTVKLIIVFKTIYILLNHNNKSKNFAIILGDLTYFMNARIHINIAILGFLSIALISP